ncbi:MAG: phosphatase PAP2 family protein [Verrucomicrobia bacterium]|nr:phosphatase PAP2 family protein [Verrucomicrobiota bacterium]
MEAFRHPRQWLSVALLTGLLVMAAAGALFIYLADEVGEQAWLTGLDSMVAQFFHHHGGPWLVHAFEAITLFGSASTLTLVGLAIALLLCALRRWSLLLGWVAALVGTGLLNRTLKGVVRRLRPKLPEPWVTEPGWSFPSGHAMGSLVAYGFLAYLLTRITPPHFPRQTAIALLAGLVLLIGFSRIYLGVHFLSDVIGGYAAATVWLTFCILMTHRTQGRIQVSREPGSTQPPA